LVRRGEGVRLIEAMTKHYNKPSEKDKRRKLRQNQTNAEELVWRFLRKRQMSGYKFRRQYSVDHFVIDFYCPELKLAIEVDGESHNEPGQQKKDKSRQKHLESFNIKFVRIKDEELLGNPEKAFGKIENAIKLLEKI
jgi:very-short-patch-repair endonuclease